MPATHSHNSRTFNQSTIRQSRIGARSNNRKLPIFVSQTIASIRRNTTASRTKWMTNSYTTAPWITILYYTIKNIKYFYRFSKQLYNDFLSSAQTQSANKHLCYRCIDYCNTSNSVCTDLIIYMHILSVIPNLCTFFQNFKIVTTRTFSEVALEYFWTSSHILQVPVWSNYSIYIAETPEWVVKMKIDFLPSILLPSLLHQLVTLFCRDIDTLHPFHFG